MSGWFGVSWGAPVCRDSPKVAAPVGAACGHCSEPIGPCDNGLVSVFVSADGPRPVAFHYECQMRMIVGGANHIAGNCLCCGGTQDPDPPGLSRREAAVLACFRWEDEQRHPGLKRPPASA